MIGYWYWQRWYYKGGLGTLSVSPLMYNMIVFPTFQTKCKIFLSKLSSRLRECQLQIHLCLQHSFVQYQDHNVHNTMWLYFVYTYSSFWRGFPGGWGQHPCYLDCLVPKFTLRCKLRVSVCWTKGHWNTIICKKHFLSG